MDVGFNTKDGHNEEEEIIEYKNGPKYKTVIYQIDQYLEKKSKGILKSIAIEDVREQIRQLLKDHRLCLK